MLAADPNAMTLAELTRYLELSRDERDRQASAELARLHRQVAELRAELALAEAREAVLREQARSVGLESIELVIVKFRKLVESFKSLDAPAIPTLFRWRFAPGKGHGPNEWQYGNTAPTEWPGLLEVEGYSRVGGTR
jgi:hypothetical protein